ncbi:MAG: hypothetical protein Kow0031_32280 [Anaerolineae bacterium]
MKLSYKLTLVFLLLSILPLGLVGFLAFAGGRRAIEQNTINRLVATTTLKEAEFSRWLEVNQRQLASLAQRPLVREAAIILTGQPVNAPDYQPAVNHLLDEHLFPALETNTGFFELAMLNGETGQVIASTNPALTGLYRDNEPYFIEGRSNAIVTTIHQEFPETEAMLHISAPVVDRNGDTVAVLAGHVDLAEMTGIMLQGGELTRTEESYIVNKHGRFVTQSKFNEKIPREQAIHTAGVDRCLGQNNGSGLYADYRGVPVIGAYRWIEPQELCILTEIDQAEAFTPIRWLQISIIITAGIIAVLVAVAGAVFTRRSFIMPIAALEQGAEEIGRGNLAYRIRLNRNDELGRLAAAFNRMAAQRQEMEDALRHAHDELETRVDERTAALHKSEKSYRQLAETAQDIILTHRLDGRITYINPTGLTLSQYSREELAEMPIEKLVARRQLDQLLVRSEKRLQRDESVMRFEVDFVPKDGQVVPLDVTSSLLRRDDEPDEVLILARDIRERKAAEKALSERAAELTRSNAELEQFAYIASHDLQEPLRMVTSYLNLLEQRYGPQLDEDAREFIGFALDGANRMKALIKGLLQFSRVGTRGYPPAPVNMEAILDHVLSTLHMTISHRQAVITRDPLPTIMADGFELEQLLQNLLVNALKFNTATPPRVHVGARRQETNHLFWVQDNGIGIEGSYHQQVFEIFRRLHTREEYSGTGIGLAVCKKIIERHGGRIWVESEPGQGATFYFTLPDAPLPGETQTHGE